MVGPDRLARNMLVFCAILLSSATIFFGSLPWLDSRVATEDERAAVFRAALEGCLEGSRISERTRNVMVSVRKAMKKMGGNAHSGDDFLLP